MKTFVWIYCFVLSFETGLGQTPTSKYPDYTNHPCKRVCINGETPKICKYEFTIEWMRSMGPNCQNCLLGNEAQCSNPECMVADGTNRLIIVYNRQLPGPGIEVCHYDVVVIKLDNRLLDVSTSIHWHGMLQKGTQYMDGVPHITQCPIHPYSIFQYSFTATEAGTHFYHSHSGVQKANGAFGYLIVRQATASNPHQLLYDFDLSSHTIIVADWFYELPLAVLFGILRNYVFNERQISTLIINGMGPSSENNVPPKRFQVTSGKRYRFRIIHAGATVCPIEVRISSHTMTVIATDGSDIEPIVVDSLFITNGERYDVIVNANQKVDSYVIIFNGTIICNRVSYAILEYTGATRKQLTLANASPITNKISANCINEPNSNPNCRNFNSMKAKTAMNSKLKATRADQIYYIGFDIVRYAKPMFKGVNDEEATSPHLNQISMTYPSTPLLQNDVGHNYCSADNMSCAITSTVKMCECVHKVDFLAGAVIEVVMVDQGDWVNLSHPMHLHGYKCCIVAHDKLGSNITLREVRNMNEAGLISKNLINPPCKDTMPVPDGGYTIFRFISDNPGYWMLHCHVDFHLEEGMGMVFHTGGRSPMIPPNFPTCSNYYG